MECQPDADKWLDFRRKAIAIEPRQPQANRSWVNIDGVPGQEGQQTSVHWKEILSSGVVPDLYTLRLRDPQNFSVGGIHQNFQAWDDVLFKHPQRVKIGRWIRNRVDILEFAQPFSGTFKGSKYKADLPPRKMFPNHPSCRNFSEFISSEILSRLTTGAFRIWGVVGSDEPPHLVMPLTVEPSKPRLCLDARFLNLWMRDVPFSLDRLADVPRYVYKSSFMTKCDDKSGYDHVMLTKGSQTYVGFSFGGLRLVCTTLPFGWKISPYIYHSIGLAATGFLRSQGVPCSLYIDDRLNGELITATGRWARLPQERSAVFRYEAAKAAIYVVLSVLIALGYTIGIKKSIY